MSASVRAVPEPPGGRQQNAFANFFRLESAGAIVLLVAAAAALLLANSALHDAYEHFLHAPVAIQVGRFSLHMDLLEFVDEFLMALFFLVIGLEIKREFIAGELSSIRRAVLPILAAVGGMVAPALIYLAINHSDPIAARGWGVPVATDIAFALGVLALASSRVPTGMRVFLTALAIADDIGAIMIIALFYTTGMHWAWLVGAAVIVLVLVGLNYLGVDALAPYLVLGFLLWFCVLESGFHSTIAGVALAFTIPATARVSPGEFSQWARSVLDRFEAAENPDAHVLQDDTQQRQAFALQHTARYVSAPLQRLEHGLHPFTTFAVLPLFAFCNAGVDLRGTGLQALFTPVAIGVFLGLVVGKPLGITLASYLTVKAGIADLPAGMQWRHVAVVGILGGIGFTMAIFVANLAFARAPEMLAEAKIAVMVTSLVAGGLGWIALRAFCPVCTLPEE